MYTYIDIYINMSISLSLYIYIYIFLCCCCLSVLFVCYYFFMSFSLFVQGPRAGSAGRREGPPPSPPAAGLVL